MPREDVIPNESYFEAEDEGIEFAPPAHTADAGPSARHVGESAGRPRSRSDASGRGVSLADVHAVFDELLLLPDSSAIDIALAGVVANYATGDPVWPLLVGPPGCGKSEIVTSLAAAPGVWELSSLTPQTLLSGFETGNRDRPASLLFQIGKFGILAFKDLTTVLTMHREARAAIIGQLREVADGRTAKSFGNGVRLEWRGKLGLVAGVTPVIDEQHAFLAVMGERFLLYRMPEVGRREIARRSLSKRGVEPALREQIQATVGGFLERFMDCGRLDLPEEFTEPLVTLTDIVTRARSGVARDGFSRELLYLPEPEAPTRLAKQLAQLAAAALAMGVSPEDAWRLAQKTGWDSVPAVRNAVIRCLAESESPLTTSHLQELTGLPERTVRRVTEDVVALHLATRTKVQGKWYVEQSEIANDYWQSEAGPTLRAEGSRPEPSEGVLRVSARDVGGGTQDGHHQPLVGANGYLDYLAAAFGDDLLTIEEVLEQERLHLLVAQAHTNGGNA